MKQLFTTLLLLAGMLTYAQRKESFPATATELEAKILALDIEVFEAYNTCNLEKFKIYLTDDLEFYHDKGGLMTGSAKTVEAMQKYICVDPNKKIIRKPVEGTLKVFPLEGYGAILVGEHNFYAVDNGVERKTGIAKFTHVWLLKNGQWKMARILSYDHQPAQ